MNSKTQAQTALNNTLFNHDSILLDEYCTGYGATKNTIRDLNGEAIVVAYTFGDNSSLVLTHRQDPVCL